MYQALKKNLLFGALLWCGLAAAMEPMPSEVSMTADLEGQNVVIHLTNHEPFRVEVKVFPARGSSVLFETETVQLNTNQSETLRLKARELGKGSHVLHVETQVTDEKQVVRVGPKLHQSIIHDGSKIRFATFEEAFLNRRETIVGKSQLAEIDLGGARYSSVINPRAFKANVIPNGIKIQPIQLKNLMEYTKMPLRQLPNGVELGQGGEHPRVIPTPRVFEIDNPIASMEDERNEMTAENFSPSAIVVKGHMSLKMDATTYKAAWGWVVRAWQNVGGNWNFLGWTYVGGDGSWQIALNGVKNGIPVRVEYQTKNRFVSLQDAHGNPYTWGDNWNLTGGTTDIGYRFADLTTNGDLPGVDKLYEGATNVWVKFFNNGMNALRDQPIQVTYPNTLASGQCVENTGSGPFAWSCSYWNDGRIYIIPEHAYASVVQHEIAHSINSFYWNGSWPSGAGGMHDLYNCYNNGLALTEGFADFISYWVEFDRTATNPVAPYFNMNIESIPGAVCGNQTAEMRVAATFWDLYDVPNDGSNPNAHDGLYCINQAAPVALYLNHAKSAMSDYLPIIQSGQSSYWQGQLADLFRQNKIIN